MENFFDQEMFDDADDTCSATDCPVHFRNDHQGLGEYGHPYLIKYVGKYAVFSDVALKRVSPEEGARSALTAFVLLLAGTTDEEAEEFIQSALESFTYIYRVNNGAIMSSGEPVEKYHGKPSDVEELHAMAVEMVKVRQEV